ncbi:MAG TPA: thiamine phosphate synthase [Candidatus Eremiobacteraceae bacterium]|nr:thiamine phosphate synthase [Candidatus Eremiobacteraceae bacterium]
MRSRTWSAAVDRLPPSDRLASVRLYLITDAAPTVRPIEKFLEEAVGGGVDMVQLREKSLDDLTLLDVARRCASTCRRLGVPFIVNDRPDIALLAHADGVHLGQDDLPAADARRIVGSDAIIGLSTHSRAQVDAALASSVDYLGVGPVWETPTKPGRAAAGLDLVSYAGAHAAKPFFAIGGIDPSTVADVIGAGAKSVSVLRWIAQSEQPRSAAQAMLRALSLAGDI